MIPRGGVFPGEGASYPAPGLLHTDGKKIKLHYGRLYHIWLMKTKTILKHDILQDLGKLNEKIVDLERDLMIYSSKYSEDSKEIQKLQELSQKIRQETQEIFRSVTLETARS